jgi:preprotein translocase subunit YajC
MTQTNIIGLVALVLGAVLLFFAWRASQAPMDQMSEALTGRFTGNTMWYLLGGIVAVVVGAGMLYRGSIQS